MTWQARLTEEKIDNAGYGDIIQVVVHADTKEEAMRLGAELLEVGEDSVVINEVVLGES